MKTTGSQTYNGLQALRIVAAVLVLMTHSTFYASERLTHTFPVWQRGATGVDIFFVLSGFVMVYSSSSLRGVANGWRIFAERRIARIVPMYWLATTVKLIAMLLAAGYVLHSRPSILKTFCSYFFLPARNIDGEIRPLLGVGWTLNFEIFFYVIFALALFSRRNIYGFVGAILSVLALGAYFRRPEWPAVAFYLNTIVLEFFFGMLIARASLNGNRLPRAVAILMFFAGFLLLLYPWPPWDLPEMLMGGVPAAMIVWSTMALERDLAWIPRWVLFLGDASYAIYLFHPLVAPIAPAILAKLHLVNPWLSVLCSIVVALSVGSLLHVTVEFKITEFLRERMRGRHKKWMLQATEVSTRSVAP